jgi:short-subunit dehydrogenase
MSTQHGTFPSVSIVITGASSGIGRAAALAFASKGARLVLAARREAVLQELVAQCEGKGGQAVAVVTDVTDPEAVVRLAQRAADQFGSIDVWINNAGVGAVGAFEAVPIATHDRVIQTNLLGYLHGAHAVLPFFKRQQRGILINTISLGGWAPSPYSVAYSASKFGLRGYSEALRAELRPWPQIHVCDVFPAFIDTPGFQHGANYVGREIKPVPPVYAAEKVANAMVALVNRPRASVTVGASAYVARLAHALLGERSSRAMAWLMRRYFDRANAAPVGDGSLFESASIDAQVSGGWSK